MITRSLPYDYDSGFFLSFSFGLIHGFSLVLAFAFYVCAGAVGRVEVGKVLGAA